MSDAQRPAATGIRRSRTPPPRRCSATASCCRSCPGPGASDYERYLRTDELLALQKTPEEMEHRDELLFQTVHQSSELWLKLAVLRDRGGDRAHRRGRPRAGRAAARPGQPLRHLHDRRAAHARAPVALGVPRGAARARPRQRLRLARLAAAAAPRAAALEGVHGAARAPRPRAHATSTCTSAEHPASTTSPRP